MKFIFYLACLATFFSSCTQQDGLILSENGTSDYVIVIPQDPDSLELRSASELQRYLEQIGGVRIPIAHESTDVNKVSILIGNTTLNKNIKLSDNQIYIESNGNRLIILGSNPRNTLFAVYTFLERFLDCRFYTPDVKRIPQSKVIKIPASFQYTYIPEITTRTVHSRLFYDHPEFADQRKVTHEAFPTYVPTARVHTFHVFMPEEVFYRSHPEYYALRNGRRIPTQLCLTNPEVFRIVRDSVEVLLKKYPEARVISVSQDDNAQYCECTACSEINERESSPSGSMIDFVNRIARKFPDKTISTLAYQYTRKAPQTIKPEANVLITLCSIECDRSAPIEEKCMDFAQDLKEWGAISNNIRIWDYTTQFTNFLAPFPNLLTLQPNIRLFRDNHARWIFEQHSHQPSELFELRSYLTASLLWDPDISVDSVMEDFIDGYYREAGPMISQYIQTIHASLNSDPDFFLFLYGDPSQAFTSFLNPVLLNKYDSLFTRAETAVANQPDLLNRVKKARLGVDYAILEACRKNLDPPYMLTETQNGKREIPARLLQRLENFRETCAANEIINMNEMRFTVDEYVDFYEKTLERARIPNLALGKSVILNQPPKKYADEDPQVLTDGAFGGSSFYANWLGFDGNDLDAVIDLGSVQKIHEISSAFLQVVNHIVFFPERVSYYYSNDGKNFIRLGHLENKHPLTRTSKTNDVQYFPLSFSQVDARYVKVVAVNGGEAPIWHFGAGLPSWIFVDELEIR
jgi:hypothetical protein